MAKLFSPSSSTSFCRYAVVTGGNKGIGFGICRQLASNGITVVLTARDERRGIEALEKLKRSSGGLYGDDRLIFHKLDVTDPSTISTLSDFIKSQFGKLDILVNNAGISGESVGRTSAYEAAKECIETNYYGPKRMTEAFIPLLQLSESPRIVNVSSGMGQLESIPNKRARKLLGDAENLTEKRVDEVLNEFLKDFKDGCLQAKGWPSYWPAYRVSKAAVNAYTRIAAKKYPNIIINCVCPGWVKTDIDGNSGILSVEEGAKGPVRLALLPDGSPSGAFFSRDRLSSF